MKALNLNNQRFGRLTVISKSGSIGGRTVWYCRCDCGGTKEVLGKLLTIGHVNSCGCLVGGITKHGHSRKGNMTRTYRAWVRMRQRCLNENDGDFPNYGGRGIKIHPDWELFSNFLRDMGECPEGLELDRIDFNRNYEPTNCRWATERVQALNRRWTLWVEVGGKKMPMKQAAKELGLNYSSLKNLTAKNGKYGIGAQEAITRLMSSRRKSCAQS